MPADDSNPFSRTKHTMTEDFDDALRNAIGSRSGGPVHTTTARQAVIARAERTRTVRTGAIVGTTGLVVIAGLLVILAVAAFFILFW